MKMCITSENDCEYGIRCVSNAEKTTGIQEKKGLRASEQDEPK